MDNRVLTNVQDIWRGHKIYLGSHDKVEIWIDGKKKIISRSENPEMSLPARSAFTIIICNSDDATQLHRKRKFTKSQGKNNKIMYMEDAKKKNAVETHIQKIRIYTQDIGMEFGTEIYAKKEKNCLIEKKKNPKSERFQKI